MKDQRKTEIKVGIMVIFGLIIFLWILGWAKNFSLRDTDRMLKVKFNNVAGLEIGDYVTVNGVRKGIVEDFNVENNNVIVTLSLDYEIILKKDAVFSITMLDLMGGKKVDIKPGASTEELDYDKIHTGIFSADIPSVMSMLGNAEEDLAAILKEVNFTLTSINKYLSDEKIDAELKTSLSNIKDISDKLNLIIDENRQGMKELIDNTVMLTKDTRDIISANRDGIDSSIKSLHSVLVETDSLAKRLNRLSEETVNQQNNLGKLLYDEEFMNNLSTTLSRTKELIEILTEQLQNEGLKVDADVDLF